MAIGEGVFVAGLEEGGSNVEASLRKYDLNSGALLWSTVFPSSTAGTDSAFESIFATSEGGAILGGLSNGEPGGLEGFKSYGNPISGEGSRDSRNTKQTHTGKSIPKCNGS